MGLSTSPSLGQSSSGPRLAIDRKPDAGLDLRHLFGLNSGSDLRTRGPGSARGKSQRGLCDFPGDLMRKEMEDVHIRSESSLAPCVGCWVSWAKGHFLTTSL